MSDETQTPPHDELAEQSVIGAILLSATAMQDVTEAMQPGDFYQPRNETILRAALTLVSNGAPVDAITVGDELQRTGQTQQAGGMAYLHHCTSVPSTVTNAGYHAAIVAEKAVMRRLVEAGTRIVQMGYAAEGESRALVETARAEVDGVTTETIKASAPIGDLVDALAEQLDEPPLMAPTPWPALDRVIGGWRPGALYVIAGRPGSGKSVLAGQIALGLAPRGTTGMVSLEMPPMEVLQRLISATGQLSMSSLVNRNLTKSDWSAYAQAGNAIRNLPLHVVDGLSTFVQVSSFARSLHRKGGMQGLVVDYLGLLSSGSAQESRRHDVEAITRACKQLAQALEIPVFLLAQLNRQGVARGKGKIAPPVLTDLRESGSLEQDADVVLLLHREDGKGAVLHGDVAKNRHGETGKFELKFEGQFARAVSKVWGDALLDEGEVA